MSGDERDLRDLIAVIGLAGRFPGAGSVDALWELLWAGREGVRRHPAHELEVDPGVASRPDFVPVSGVVEGIEDFDPAFFGMSRDEAERADPQHRLALECAWEALEDAGLDPVGQAGTPTAVVLGAGTNTYGLGRLLRQRAVCLDTFQTLLGMDRDYLATRVSYKLGLQGPALAVSSACSTGLVAVLTAAGWLLDFTVDLAVAGGVSLAVPHRIGYLHEPGGIFSSDGRCRPFDAGASGTVPGSGAGVVVLKRLADARRDGDPVRAVLSGFAVNNDGNQKVGYTAPSVAGQAAVIRAARAMAGLRPHEIPFVETHGTATALGDAIEIAALKQAFGEDLPPGSVLLGGLKSNLGHLNAASGVAGFIKAVLAVERGLIPPTLHFERPNPHLGLDGSPFRVVSAPTPWPEGRPRRAAVSSFGFGGTNAHAIVEAAPAVTTPPARGPQLLLLSARSPGALEATAERLASRLEGRPAPLDAVARTLRAGRAALPERLAVVAEGADAPARLRAGPWRVRARAGARPPIVVFLCTGQGGDSLGVALDLYKTDQVFRKRLDWSSRLIPGLDLYDLMERSAEGPLADTALAQPALVAVTLAMAESLEAAGVRPDALLGHSAGEIAAAALAGALSPEAALRFAAARGAAMARAEEGAMLSVSLPEARVSPWLSERVELVVVNGPSQVVLGGRREDLEPVEAALAGEGALTRWLRARRAFHSRAIEPVLDEILAAAREAGGAAPTRRILNNVSGGWHSADRPIGAAYWAEQARRPVRFDRCLDRLYADHPRLVFVELGPGRALADLALAHPGRGESTATFTLPLKGEDGVAARLRALGALWCAGLPLDPQITGGAGPRLSLPGVAMDRIRCWDPGELPTSRPPSNPNRFVEVLDD